MGDFGLNEINISFYLDDSYLHNQKFFSGYKNPTLSDLDYDSLYNFLINNLAYSQDNTKVANDKLYYEIMYGNYAKCFLNFYFAYYFLIEQYDSSDFKLVVPSNFFAIKEKHHDFISYLNSPFFKTQFFEFTAKQLGRNVRYETSLAPVICSKNKYLYLFNLNRFFFSFFYTFFILVILRIKNINKVIGVRYAENASKKIIIDKKIINIKFDFLFYGRNCTVYKYKHTTGNESISEFFQSFFHTSSVQNNSYFKMYLNFLGLVSHSSRLVTDCYFIDNSLFKNLVYLRFKSFGYKTDIIAHGATFFLNADSWIYLKTPVYNYYGNGTLEFEDLGVKINSGYSGIKPKFCNSVEINKSYNCVIIYLYPHYQSVRKNNAEAISKYHFSDIEKIIFYLNEMNFKIILKPHKNSSSSSLFFNQFISDLKQKYSKIEVNHSLNGSEEVNKSIHLYTYLSTGWFEKIEEGYLSICFNPFYLDLNMSKPFQSYINSNFLNICYFNNVDRLINSINKNTYTSIKNIDGIRRYGDVYQYLNFIYELDKGGK